MMLGLYCRKVLQHQHTFQTEQQRGSSVKYQFPLNYRSVMKKIWNWIKNLFTPKLRLENEITKGYCDEHSKYKHRCPKCRELAGVA